MTRRDPERIDRMVGLFREAWQAYPDLRLTQLVINLADKGHDCGPVYYSNDAEMERRLEAFVRNHRQGGQGEAENSAP